MTAIRDVSDRLAWQADAACRAADPADFFPDGPENAPPVAAQIERAKQVCSACPVRRECLEYAMRTRAPHGVWGGTTEEERAAARHQDLLARRRARSRAAA
jgi:WhiB family transcriptional regulator, redox-sensing transcriptional regulator